MVENSLTVIYVYTNNFAKVFYQKYIKINGLYLLKYHY